jgi:hypothetical protein
MEAWEFLLQKKETRSWFPIKNRKLALATGQYRIVAQGCPADTDVEIRVFYQTLDQAPPQKRSQKRTGRTNKDGLMVVIPFTELKTGLWEFRFNAPSLDTESQTLLLRVQPPKAEPLPSEPIASPPIASPPAEVAQGRDRNGTAPRVEPRPIFTAPPPPPPGYRDHPLNGVPSDPLPRPEAPPEPTPDPNDFDSVTAHSLLEQSISSLESILAQVTEPAPYVPPPSPPQVTPVEATDHPPAPNFSQVQLGITLLQDTFVRRQEEPILISGHVNFLPPQHPSILDQGFDGVLRYELRDPQTFDLLLNVEQPLSDATIPLVFNYLLDVPTGYETRLILGEVVLEVYAYQAEQTIPYKLTSQSFSITASLAELLDTVKQVPLPQPEPPPEVHLPPTQVPPLDDFWNSGPSVKARPLSVMPPRLNQPQGPRRKALDLPNFSSPPPRRDRDPLALPPPPEATSPLPAFPDLEAIAPPPPTEPAPVQPPDPPEATPPLSYPTEEDWAIATQQRHHTPSEPIPVVSLGSEAPRYDHPPPLDSRLATVLQNHTARGEQADSGPGSEPFDVAAEPDPHDPAAATDKPAAAAASPSQFEQHFWRRLSDLTTESDRTDAIPSGPDLTKHASQDDDHDPADTAHPDHEDAHGFDYGEHRIMGLDSVEEALSAIAQAEQRQMTTDANRWERGDWPIQEFVVDDEDDDPDTISTLAQRPSPPAPKYDTSGLPYPPELNTVAPESRPTLPNPDPDIRDRPIPPPEPTAVPAPILEVQGGELTAGEMILMTVKLPPQTLGTVYVKLWVQDRETRQLLDGPRAFIEFEADGTGSLATMTQLIVPLGAQSVRFEAVTINVATQQESRKTSCDRTVIPPNLPTFTTAEEWL